LADKLTTNSMKIERMILKGEFRIKVEFPYSIENIQLIKQIPGAIWNREIKSWHIPYNEKTYLLLKSLFKDLLIPEIEFDIESNEVHKNLRGDFQTEKNPELEEKSINAEIEIYELPKKIVIKMPKEEKDIDFIKSFLYSRWNSREYSWELPNFPGNLEMVKKYFHGRISILSVSDNIEIDHLKRSINKNQVLCIRTLKGRVNIIGAFNNELIRAIRKIPYYSWDRNNKWWSIPFSERFIEDIKNFCQAQQLTFLFEEETKHESKIPRLSSASVVNYRSCPNEYIEKLVELRYSSKTIKSYKSCLEEFINHYPGHDITEIDEQMIITFIRYLVVK
jgi:integrase/recombinase XerD